MRLMISLFIVALSALHFTTPSITHGTTVSLLDATINQYLQEMKAQYGWTPSQFIIETADKATYQALRTRYGSTQVLVKTTEELQAYSTQHVGKTVEFFNLDIENSDDAYQVYVVTESIRTIMQGGAPAHNYGMAQQGRACTLQFDAKLAYQGIDCLLQSEEEEK